jgi:hypothetical protein
VPKRVEVLCQNRIQTFMQKAVKGLGVCKVLEMTTVSLNPIYAAVVRFMAMSPQREPRGTPKIQ